MMGGRGSSLLSASGWAAAILFSGSGEGLAFCGGSFQRLGRPAAGELKVEAAPVWGQVFQEAEVRKRVADVQLSPVQETQSV